MSLCEGFAKSLHCRSEMKLDAAFRVVNCHFLSAMIKIDLKLSVILLLKNFALLEGFKIWGTDPASI